MNLAAPRRDKKDPAGRGVVFRPVDCQGAGFPVAGDPLPGHLVPITPGRRLKESLRAA